MSESEEVATSCQQYDKNSYINPKLYLPELHVSLSMNHSFIYRVRLSLFFE